MVLSTRLEIMLEMPDTSIVIRPCLFATGCVQKLMDLEYLYPMKGKQHRIVHGQILAISTSHHVNMYTFYYYCPMHNYFGSALCKSWRAVTAETSNVLFTHHMQLCCITCRMCKFHSDWTVRTLAAAGKPHQPP